MPLQLAESIQLKTGHGTSEVQLLVGDITDLEQDDAVDVIMVSSFMGDYSTVGKGTLISALYHKLKIDVGDLAMDKDIDMRGNFHCWVSKPLDKSHAYRRLVCFERGRRSDSGTTSQQISVLFRAMTPIFNNESTSVITPLLATGNQGQSRVAVLRAMVDGACHWIKAGLPLRCLKIVLYTVNPFFQLSQRDQEAVDLFKKLKDVWETSTRKEKEKEQAYDVFISHSNHDNHWAELIHKQLLEENPKLRVYKKQIQFSADQVWQQNLFHVMMQSHRIVVVLSPAYVESPECLEQFNMALCVNRVSAHHQICPMYVETVPSLPTYMQLVQYVECRERKDGEVSKTLIRNACRNLLEEQQDMQEVATVAPVKSEVYDVFISYAHRNPIPAETMLKKLQEAYPEINVFFDRDELTTGSLWQQTLYNSMDNSLCVVALLSPAYVKSEVCREEYNIALNRALAEKEISLVPVCIEEMDTIPKAFSFVPIIDGTTDLEAVLSKVTEDVVSVVKGHEVNGPSIVMPNLSVSPLDVQENHRKQEFDKYFKREDKTILFQTDVKGSNPKSAKSSDGDIVVSFSHDSLRLALILSELIKQISPNTVCKFISEHNKDRLHLLDRAKLVIVLMSDGYVQSEQLLEELHLSLCRQRREKPTPMVYLIQGVHFNPDPFHLHVIKYRVAVGDKLWTSLALKGVSSDKGKLKKIDTSTADQMFIITRNEIKGSYSCSLAERLALSKAALEITTIVLNGSCPTVDVGANILNIGKLHTTEDNTGEHVSLKKCLKQTVTAKSGIQSERVTEVRDRTHQATQEADNVVKVEHPKTDKPQNPDEEVIVKKQVETTLHKEPLVKVDEAHNKVNLNEETECSNERTFDKYGNIDNVSETSSTGNHEGYHQRNYLAPVHKAAKSGCCCVM